MFWLTLHDLLYYVHATVARMRIVRYDKYSLCELHAHL